MVHVLILTSVLLVTLKPVWLCDLTEVGHLHPQSYVEAHIPPNVTVFGVTVFKEVIPLR